MSSLPQQAQEALANVREQLDVIAYVAKNDLRANGMKTIYDQAGYARMIIDSALAREEHTTPPEDEEIWRHKKRGTTYTIVGEAELQAEEPLSEGHTLTVYRCRETGKLWARNVPEFHDGRFEKIALDAHRAARKGTAV